MTLDACTEAVRTQDPDRFGAVLVAEPADRPALITLYALNLEIARAPFQSNEPMLAEMRLQWWIERLAEMGQGREPPLHDVLTPLWDCWGRDAGDFVDLAEARRRDCAREPFADGSAVTAYIDATAGGLMWCAARRLGAPGSARETVALQARGAGIANWLRALPQLQPLGLGLAGGDPAQLAQIALTALTSAAARHSDVPKTAAAALYPGPRIRPFLTQIAEGKIDPLQQGQEITPFQRRASFALLAMTNRWWR